MGRYDVFILNDDESLVLDVQADLLKGLSTRIVVPLIELSKAPKPAKKLNPVLKSMEDLM